jgi:hypothetical protein
MPPIQKQEPDKPVADKPDADVKVSTAGLMGRYEPAAAGIDELKGDELFAAAQAKAPSLTKEFVTAFKLDDEDLRKIARGEVSPPPAIGPLHTADLYLTPGGWQQTPPGVKPEDVGGNAISR